MAPVATPNPPVLPAVDPSAAVSLPRARSASQGGADRASAPDMLADWGWKSDSHAAIVDDGSEYEDDAPKAARKRLLYAIGGALGVILLIVVIGIAASGGGDDKDKEKEVEPPIADTSRTADPRPSESQANAKMADPPAPPVQLPAYEATTTEPTKVEPPPVEPTKVEPAPVEPVKVAAVDTAKEDASRAEAAKLEAAKADAEAKKAAKLEVAKAEAAKAELAKADAAAQKAAKQETARLAKIEAANVAAAKAADAQRLKAEKAETARLAKAAKLEAAKTAKPAPVETAKVKPKEPKAVKLTGNPIDPYAAAKPEKAPKADPSIAYKTGFQQYVRGDTNGALTTFKGSLSSSPSYAPTWRGLGLVYEKLGQKAQAKKSFLRYLQLSPNAGDADQIRSRMEKLGS